MANDKHETWATMGHQIKRADVNGRPCKVGCGEVHTIGPSLAQAVTDETAALIVRDHNHAPALAIAIRLLLEDAHRSEAARLSARDHARAVLAAYEKDGGK